jgi:hypothetical protein
MIGAIDTKANIHPTRAGTGATSIGQVLGVGCEVLLIGGGAGGGLLL